MDNDQGGAEVTGQVIHGTPKDDVGVDESADIGSETGDEGGTDGIAAQADTKVSETESNATGELGDNGRGEGPEVGGDRDEHAETVGEEKGATAVEAAFNLLRQREAEIERLKSMTKQAESIPDSAPMTEESWANLEERFGGMSRTQIQPMAEFVDRTIKSVEERFEARFARMEKEQMINAMAEQDGTRDIRTHRKEVEQYLAEFDPRQHSDPKLLKMALIYARGLKSQSEVKKAMDSKERGLKVLGSGKPNMGGGSAGGSGNSVKLSPMERQAAKLGGMSDREYAAMRGNGRKK